MTRRVAGLLTVLFTLLLALVVTKTDAEDDKWMKAPVYLNKGDGTATFDSWLEYREGPIVAYFCLKAKREDVYVWCFVNDTKHNVLVLIEDVKATTVLADARAS